MSTASTHPPLDLDPTPGDETRVQMPHPEIFKALRPGMLLLLDDGRVRLRVGERTDEWCDVTVESGHKLSDRKGVAVPQAVRAGNSPHSLPSKYWLMGDGHCRPEARHLQASFQTPHSLLFY